MVRRRSKISSAKTIKHTNVRKPSNGFRALARSSSGEIPTAGFLRAKYSDGADQDDAGPKCTDEIGRATTNNYQAGGDHRSETRAEDRSSLVCQRGPVQRTLAGNCSATNTPLLM